MFSPTAAVDSGQTPAAAGNEIEAGLFDIVRRFLKVQDADWSTATTMEEAKIDSLDLVEVIFEIEDRFGVEINFNANAKPVAETSFGDVVDLIRSALAAKVRMA